MKGFATFLIGFGIAVVIAGLSIWGYDAGRVTMAEGVDVPGVRLLDEEG